MREQIGFRHDRQARVVCMYADEFYARFSSNGEKLYVSHILRAFKRSDGSVWFKRLDGYGEVISEMHYEIPASTIKGDGRTQVLTVDSKQIVRVVDDTYVQRMYPYSRKPTWWSRLKGWFFRPSDAELLGSYGSNL
jgi:hypothetical protein